MNAAVAEQVVIDPAVQRMQQVLEKQKSAFRDELPVSAQTRIDRINRCIALLFEHQDALCEAMDRDFGKRPALMSKFVDISSSVSQLKHARSHLKAWMKDERRPVRFPLGLLGAKAKVSYQPKGSVGVIAPWNFPVNMAFGPMTCALAAGNRVMVKPSELTPASSELMAKLVSEYFDESEIWFATGGPEVGKAFSALAFDHLLFTHIMRAAAENLVPVTLELGGKSPTIIGQGADLTSTAERIILGKTMNTGQVCLAPDYIFVQKQETQNLLTALKSAASSMQSNANDCTSIVSDRHCERIKTLLEQANASGAQIIETVKAETFKHPRQLPLSLVLNPKPDLGLMKEEIFGPILPVLEYEKIDEVISYINANERPLGLYYFGDDKNEQQQVLSQTISGGVTLNDVIFHVSVHDLPFGGVGASGMGAYHGKDGFKTFSHARAIYQQTKLPIGKLLGMIPPYGKKLEKTLKMELKP